MSDIEELLPCPFCNHKVHVNFKDPLYYVSCPECLARVKGCTKEWHAIESWNARTTDPIADKVTDEMVDKAEAAMRRLWINTALHSKNPIRDFAKAALEAALIGGEGGTQEEQMLKGLKECFEEIGCTIVDCTPEGKTK